MMLEKENILDEYFRIAQKETIDIPLSTVSGILENTVITSGSKLVVKSLFNLKYIIMSSAIVVSIITWTLILTSNSPDSVQKNKFQESNAQEMSVINVQPDTNTVHALLLASSSEDSSIEEKSILVESFMEIEAEPIKDTLFLQKKDTTTLEPNAEALQQELAKDTFVCENLVNKENKTETEQQNTTKLQYDQIYLFGEYREAWAMIKKGRKYGFIDTQGQEVVPPIYSGIWYFGEYKEDWAMVKQKGKYGFIDIKGQEVVPLIYSSIENFGEYKEDWAKVKKKGNYGFIDTQGQKVVPTIYSSISYFGEYKEDWAMVKKDGKYGFIDTKGKEVVPLIYSGIWYFGEYKKDWAMVKKDGKYGFIDTKGQEVVPPIYSSIEYFGEYKEDWAKVKKDGEYRFIDTTGKEVSGTETQQLLEE